jgi:hypothetical protein
MHQRVEGAHPKEQQHGEAGRSQRAVDDEHPSGAHSCAGDDVVRLGVIPGEAFGAGARYQRQSQGQGQNDESKAGVPLHPGAGEKKRSRAVLDGGQDRETRRRYARDRLEQSVRGRQARET